MSFHCVFWMLSFLLNEHDSYCVIFIESMTQWY